MCKYLGKNILKKIFLRKNLVFFNSFLNFFHIFNTFFGFNFFLNKFEGKKTKKDVKFYTFLTFKLNFRLRIKR